MAAFYKAGPAGIVDGFTHFVEPMVFASTPTLDACYAETGGKDGDRVLFEKATTAEYNAYLDAIESPDGRATEVVGSLPTGIDSLGQAQRDLDGNPLVAPGGDAPKADKATK